MLDQRRFSTRCIEFPEETASGPCKQIIHKQSHKIPVQKHLNHKTARIEKSPKILQLQNEGQPTQTEPFDEFNVNS